jgi:hypothetical protein
VLRHPRPDLVPALRQRLAANAAVSLTLSVDEITALEAMYLPHPVSGIN